MEYDFTGLTHAQKWLITMQGWDEQSATGPKPQKRTVEPLIARGLIFFKPRHIGGSVPMAYIVPIDVHMAWCEYCENHPEI